MATGRLKVTVECPECQRPIELATRAVQEPGRLELRFDTAPVREHVAEYHAEE
ncbi:hypothetical protein AB0903_09105 [Streptomyces sp. NPDC048389]|uniref:hypothetical protein n=1 Tax=Streptomyces sp. NPDC048389 TaxID=3154622 RepID=UPI003452610F